MYPINCTLLPPFPFQHPATHSDAEKFGIQCFCVNDPNLESINKYVADSSEGLCADERYQCSGDADEQCGGKNAMSVYAINVTSDDTEGATPKPSPTPTPMTSTPTPAAAGGLRFLS